MEEWTNEKPIQYPEEKIIYLFSYHNFKALSYLYISSILDKRELRLLKLLEKCNLIVIEEKITKEFTNCLEQIKGDKRIKNKKKYCAERYPIDIIVKPTQRWLELYRQDTAEYRIPLYGYTGSALRECIEEE
ncbi:MAG: hypothetical protein QXW45_06805 [Thermosphaera sp.]